MLRARELVYSYVVRKPKVAPAERVGRIAGTRSFPVLDIAHSVNDLGAGIGVPAAIEDAAGFAREGIKSGLIASGQVWTGILLFRVLSPGQPARL